MSRRFSRRGWLKGGIGALGAGTLLGKATAMGEAPNFLPTRVHPAIACSVNGLKEAIPRAMAILDSGGDTLDAAVEGVECVENDPNDQSVGYGGLPNEEGIVELDSCCMHGPSNNAGAVASLRSIRNPSHVARDVLWKTDHVLIVGEGALRFARAMGYTEENLLTEASRKAWLKWKRSLSNRDDWLEPWEKRPELKKTGKAGKRETGTINFNVCNAKGEVSGCTTTSGLSWKIPGRVGDSPIIGAGLYVDGRFGAAGSTGRGEAVIITCGAHTVVEGLRAGMHPKDACLRGARRVAEMNTMPYLLKKNGDVNFQVKFYAVDVKGRHGGAALYPAKYACADAKGARLEDCATIY